LRQQNWDRVEELFHRALEHPLELRPAFLDEACGGDEGLCRQVEILLSNDVRARSFFERPRVDETTVTMAMQAGRQLGPYRIISALGAGGMGEVYRAHDSKLGRDVAIKTLPREFARDSARLARFRGEARALASLNHPNVGAIYGLEEAGGFECLVLELVEGETLRGPLPLATALDRADQVAAALEAAHKKRIVHRDLKPANVKVTPEGRVKVLDFGLAKAISESARDVSQSTSAAGAHTMAGHIVGTPGYMSPEQARGQEVDQRADIWAFGCLMYELLTGRRVFKGDTVQDTIAAVLEREPDWSALPPKAPARIRDLLRRCLEKDPAKRVSEISEARRVIGQAPRGRNRWAITVLVAGVAIGGAVWMRNPLGVSDSSKWVQVTRLPDSVSQPAFSGDGRMLAFLRGPNSFVGRAEIYVKILPDGEPVQLTNDGTRKMSPVFSPDGSHIVYTVLGGRNTWDTWSIPVLGGTPELWLSNAAALTWTGPRQLMFSGIKSGQHMAILTSLEDRTEARDVYVPTHELGMAHKSYLSPDGKNVLVVEMDERNWTPCRLVPFDASSQGRQVGPSGQCTSAAWSPDGKWMYFAAMPSTGRFHIWRQRFPDGKPEQVTSGTTQEEGIAVSPDGKFLITAAASRQRPIWFHDSSGDRQISLEAYGLSPRFHAATRKVYYLGRRGEASGRRDGELWVADLDSGRNEAVLPGLNLASFDISEDGRLLVCVLDGAGRTGVWVGRLDQRSPLKQIPDVDAAWAVLGPVGSVFYLSREGNAQYLFRTSEDGSGRQQVTPEPVTELHSASVGGEWVAGLGPVPGKEAGLFEFAYSTREGTPVRLCNPPCRVEFSPDGKYLIFNVAEGWMTAGAVGRAYTVPVRPGSALPNLPNGGFDSEAEIAAAPGARRIEAADVRPGPSIDTYVFSREVVQRNLYRIPLP
jgi:serine/threonine protein kinase/Tol biopolymer transport system component